jgi:hypothetical protein
VLRLLKTSELFDFGFVGTSVPINALACLQVMA